MKQLTNKETKHLEFNSSHLMNFMLRAGKEEMHRFFHLIGWTHNGEYHADPITNKALHVKVAALSKLLGFKQNYHVNYDCRNAVWGLEHEGLKFALCYSTEGLVVQIESTPDVIPTIKDANVNTDHLYEILVGDADVPY
jgi:hypothetical protein